MAPYLTDAHHRKGDGWETVQGWYRLRLDEYPWEKSAVLNLTKACTQYYADSSGTLIWRKPALKHPRSAAIFRGLAKEYLSSGFNGMNDFEISQHLLRSNPADAELLSIVINHWREYDPDLGLWRSLAEEHGREELIVELKEACKKKYDAVDQHATWHCLINKHPQNTSVSRAWGREKGWVPSS